jgi:hypothetical protein
MEHGTILPWAGNEAAAHEWEMDERGLGYYCCRAMKLASFKYFDGSPVDVRLYERQAGEGTFTLALAEAVRVDKAAQALEEADDDVAEATI